MTKCPTEEVVLDYIAGKLDGARAAAFEAHAGSCARCAEHCAGQAAVWQSLDEWKPAPISVGFNRELWRRIDADSATEAWRQKFSSALSFGFWKRLAPLAAAVALMATGYVVDHSRQRGEQPAAAMSAGAGVVVTVSEADQLERALDDIQLLHEVDSEAVPARQEAEVM